LRRTERTPPGWRAAQNAGHAERQIWRGGATCLGSPWLPRRQRRDDVAVDTDVDIRYAISGDARLAFRVRAGGPHVIVWVPAWMSNQDLLENLAPQRVPGLLFERLSSFATVVSYDARGTGLSDPVSLVDLPTLEAWTDDLHAVVTAAGLERVVLLAGALGGPVRCCMRRPIRN
jgi:hypothetical protein